MNPGLLIVLLAFAFIATNGTVEYFVGTIFDKVEKLKPLKWLLMYVSAIFGVVLTAYYSIDAMAALLTAAGFPAETSWFGIGLTGVLVGRGANFIADLWSKYFPK